MLLLKLQPAPHPWLTAVTKVTTPAAPMPCTAWHRAPHRIPTLLSTRCSSMLVVEACVPAAAGSVSFSFNCPTRRHLLSEAMPWWDGCTSMHPRYLLSVSADCASMRARLPAYALLTSLCPPMHWRRQSHSACTAPDPSAAPVAPSYVNGWQELKTRDILAERQQDEHCSRHHRPHR